MIAHEVRAFANTLRVTRGTILALAWRDVHLKYVRSYFGFAWAVLNPLLHMLIYGFIFGVVLKLKADPIYGTDAYFLYLLCGLVPWLFFTSTIMSSANLIVANQSLVKKAVAFPSEILPIVNVTSGIISHAIALAVLVVIVAVVMKGITVYALVALLYLVMMSILCIGMGWALSSLTVYVADIRQVIDVVIRAWFFFTPIFYAGSRVPESLQPIMLLNPMQHVVEGYRYALLIGAFPPASHAAILLIQSMVAFVVGGLIFKRLKRGFADVL